jgi:hypothetical protein
VRQLIEYTRGFLRFDLHQIGHASLRAIVAWPAVVPGIGKTQIALQSLSFSLLLIIPRDYFAVAA